MSEETKEEFFDKASQAYEDGKFFHGTATLKVDLKDHEGKTLRKTGEVGEITAFLPRDETFAVIFERKVGPGNWFTFKNNFETFKEMFDIIMTCNDKDCKDFCEENLL